MSLLPISEITSWKKVYVPVEKDNFHHSGTLFLLIGGTVVAKTKTYERIYIGNLKEELSLGTYYWVPKFFLNDVDIPVVNCSALEIAFQSGFNTLPKRLPSDGLLFVPGNRINLKLLVQYYDTSFDDQCGYNMLHVAGPQGLTQMGLKYHGGSMTSETLLSTYIEYLKTIIYS